MKNRVIYIYHSCFLLRLGQKLFLFDYPNKEHLPEGAKDVVLKNINDNDEVFVFFSHGHEDHFNPEIESVFEGREKVWYVLSDDIVDLYGDEVISSPYLVVEPDEEYEYQGISIKTFLSNDLGVAYLINSDGINIYFGGDLASWAWPNLPDKAIEESNRLFIEVIEYLSTLKIHIGFSNVDFRLPNFGGGKEFLKKVKPKYFVPIHLFADPKRLDEFVKDLDVGETVIFKYKNTGDFLDLDL